MRCAIHRRLFPSLFPLPLSLPFAPSQAYLDGDDEDRAREVDRRCRDAGWERYLGVAPRGDDDRTFGGASARRSRAPRAVDRAVCGYSHDDLARDDALVTRIASRRARASSP